MFSTLPCVPVVGNKLGNSAPLMRSKTNLPIDGDFQWPISVRLSRKSSPKYC
jgi:hypothetical protein